MVGDVGERSRSARRRSGSGPGPCRRRTRWSAARSRPRSRRRGRPRAAPGRAPARPRRTRAGRAPRTRCRSDAEAARASPRSAATISAIPRRAERVEVVRVDALAGRALAELGDVLALVAVLGQRLARHPRGDRRREAVDLAAEVVDVVLALDLVAGELEQPRQRVAVGRVPAARGGQRAGRVGGDELDQDPLRDLVGAGRPPEPLARRRARPRAPPVPGVGEEEVEEAGAGDLDPLERCPRGCCRAPPRSLSAVPRGCSPSAGASSIAALVE